MQKLIPQVAPKASTITLTGYYKNLFSANRNILAAYRRIETDEKDQTAMMRPLTYNQYREVENFKQHTKVYGSWLSASILSSYEGIQSLLWADPHFIVQSLCLPVSVITGFVVMGPMIYLASILKLVTIRQIPYQLFDFNEKHISRYSMSDLSVESAERVIATFDQEFKSLSGNEAIAWKLLRTRLQQKSDAVADIGRIYTTVQQLMPSMVDRGLTLSGMLRKDAQMNKLSRNIVLGEQKMPWLKSQFVNRSPIGFLQRSLTQYKLTSRLQSLLTDAEVFHSTNKQKQLYHSDTVDTSISAGDVEEILVTGAGLPKRMVQVKSAELEELTEQYLQFALGLSNLKTQVGADIPLHSLKVHKENLLKDIPQKVKDTVKVQIKQKDYNNLTEQFEALDKDDYATRYAYEESSEQLKAKDGKVMFPLDISASAFLLAKSLVVSRFK